MRGRDTTHIDEWAALVGESVGERARSIVDSELAHGDTRQPSRRYRDETGLDSTDR